MKYRSLYRTLMIGVGVIATLVIVLSQALPEISGEQSEKIKTEQAEKNAKAQITTIPSTDVVLGAAIQIDDVDRSLLVTLEQGEEVTSGYCVSHVLTQYLQVLFRAIISPNAP